eukprot:312672-Hanusia_phi.AAC.1
MGREGRRMGLCGSLILGLLSWFKAVSSASCAPSALAPARATSRFAPYVSEAREMLGGSVQNET